MKFWGQTSAVTEVVLRLWETRRWQSKKFPLVSFNATSLPSITRAPQWLWKSIPLNKNSQIKSLLCHLISKLPQSNLNSSKRVLPSRSLSIPTDKREVNRQSLKANLSKGSLSTIISGRKVMRTKKVFPWNWNKRSLPPSMSHQSSKMMRKLRPRRARGSCSVTVISSHWGNHRMFRRLSLLRINPIVKQPLRATLNWPNLNLNLKRKRRRKL